MPFFEKCVSFLNSYLYNKVYRTFFTSFLQILKISCIFAPELKKMTLETVTIGVGYAVKVLWHKSYSVIEWE